jgi:hypothetical protein
MAVMPWWKCGTRVSKEQLGEKKKTYSWEEAKQMQKIVDCL